MIVLLNSLKSVKSKGRVIKILRWDDEHTGRGPHYMRDVVVGNLCVVQRQHHNTLTCDICMRHVFF